MSSGLLMLRACTAHSGQRAQLPVSPGQQAPRERVPAPLRAGPGLRSGGEDGPFPEPPEASRTGPSGRSWRPQCHTSVSGRQQWCPRRKHPRHSRAFTDGPHGDRGAGRRQLRQTPRAPSRRGEGHGAPDGPPWRAPAPSAVPRGRSGGHGGSPCTGPCGPGSSGPHRMTHGVDPSYSWGPSRDRPVASWSSLSGGPLAV